MHNWTLTNINERVRLLFMSYWWGFKCGDDAVGMEILKDDADSKALHKAQLKGSMTGQKGALAKSKPKVPAKRHQLFAKRFSRK